MEISAARMQRAMSATGTDLRATQHPALQRAHAPRPDQVRSQALQACAVAGPAAGGVARGHAAQLVGRWWQRHRRHRRGQRNGRPWGRRGRQRRNRRRLRLHHRQGITRRWRRSLARAAEAESRSLRALRIELLDHSLASTSRRLGKRFGLERLQLVERTPAISRCQTIVCLGPTSGGGQHAGHGKQAANHGALE